MDKSQRLERNRALHGQIEQGVRALLDSGDWQSWLDWQARFHDYSANNCWLILGQRPSASWVAGYRRWQKMGRQVRSGEKGLFIWGPQRRGQRVERDGDGEETVRSWAYWPTVSVFDIEQTDATDKWEDPPTVAVGLQGEEQAALLARLLLVSESLGLAVEQGLVMGGVQGVTHGWIDKSQRVALRDADSANQRAKTLVHEMAHSVLGHVSPDCPVQDRAVREVEAESVAYIVCSSLGFDTSAYSFAYVASWAGGDVKAATAIIKDTAARVQQAAKEILNQIEKE